MNKILVKPAKNQEGHQASMASPEDVLNSTNFGNQEPKQEGITFAELIEEDAASTDILKNNNIETEVRQKLIRLEQYRQQLIQNTKYLEEETRKLKETNERRFEQYKAEILQRMSGKNRELDSEIAFISFTKGNWRIDINNLRLS